jgi:hypothetical protein
MTDGIAAGIARGDDLATKQAVGKLLEIGWNQSSQARAPTDAQLERSIELGRGDSRALTAAWLVLIQQRRYDEALQRVDQHLAADPGSYLALRAKAWLNTVLKNYGVAMVAAQRLSAALDEPLPGSELERTEKEEAIAFLGRLLGFFGGPVADAVSQEERKSLEKKIIARLEIEEAALFEEARNGVLARHIELTDESAHSREQAALRAKAEREKALDDLQSEREKLDEHAAEIAERRKRVQDELKSELDDVARKDEPLMRELSRLSARSSALSNDLITYSSQMARLQQLAATERNRGRQQQLLFEADSLALIASRLEADLDALNRQSRVVQQQRLVLANRQAQARSAAANQIQKTDRDLAEIAKRDRRNQGLEKRTVRPASVSTSKSRALVAQATALSTYDPFPLEAIKFQLLEALK